jgi:hypothetical protein
MEVGINGANRPRRVRARERDRHAVELRAAGLTFAAIGLKLGVSDEAARKAVNRALDASCAEIAAGRRPAPRHGGRAAEPGGGRPCAEGRGRRPASHEVWLRNRARYAALLGLDLRPTPDASCAPTSCSPGRPVQRMTPGGSSCFNGLSPVRPSVSSARRVSSGRLRGSLDQAGPLISITIRPTWSPRLISHSQPCPSPSAPIPAEVRADLPAHKARLRNVGGSLPGGARSEVVPSDTSEEA